MRPTSDSELENLAKTMGFEIKTGRLKDIDKINSRFAVLNLDDYGPGTHWIAVDFKKKQTFDPYSNLQTREDIPRDLTQAYTRKQFQSLNDKDCGPLCVLWCYYMKNYEDGADRFSSEFRDIYRG